MRYKIKEFAVLTGVSVRTLHYYDEIGLLKPDTVDTANGYRFYSEKSLERMQVILFYRELDFPLKDIIPILDSPDYDKSVALKKQRELLKLKLKRTEKLISAIDEAMKGVNVMSVFDNSEYEKLRKQYADEAKEKWGGTSAYKEYESRNHTEKEYEAMNAEMDWLLKAFSECRNTSTPDSAEAQELVKKWQKMITDNYYTCTKEILSGLGKMYTADERFTKNMDRYKKGTAKFISEAIAVYCRS